MGRIWRIALIGVLLLLAAEGVARARASALPMPLKWATSNLDRKVEQIDALAKTGGASVVFVGSSTVDTAIDPSELEIGRNERPAYNASVRGGTVRMISSWTRSVVVPRLRPTTVVVGLASNEASPLGSRERGWERDYFASPAVRYLNGNETPLQRAERTFESISALARYRTWLRDPDYLRAFVGLGTAPSITATAIGDQIAPDGQYQFGLNRPYRSELYFQQVRRGAGTSSTELASLRELLSYLSKNVRNVIVVNMPVTKDYFHNRPPDQAETFDALLRSEARRVDATYLPTGIWPKTRFADPTHTNETGSRMLTGMIGRVISAGR